MVTVMVKSRVTVSKKCFKVTEQQLHLLDAEDFGLSDSKGGDKKRGDEVYSYSGRLVTDRGELADHCQHRWTILHSTALT